MEAILGRIDQAIGATAKIVDGVTDDQWSMPTPCDGWDVRALTNHFVGGLRMFAAAIDGTEAAGDSDSDWLGDDPIAAYRAASREASAAWHAPDALGKTLSLSLGPVPGPMAAVIHLTEILVHGLDLAVATGQESSIDEHMSEQLLLMMTQMGGIDSFRVPDVFGPEVTAAEDDPAHRRLMAYLGRAVCETPFQV